MSRRITVAFAHINSCFANLPAAWVNDLLVPPNDRAPINPAHLILKLTWSTSSPSSAAKDADSKITYLGWAGGASSPRRPASSRFPLGSLMDDGYGRNDKEEATNDIIEIDGRLGAMLGLKDGQKADVIFVRNVPIATIVNVEPLTEDDWEILELNAGYLEEQFMNQVRVIYPDQSLVVWIHQHTMVRLKVVSLTPDATCVRLDVDSEVIVAPKSRHLAGASKTYDPTSLPTTTAKASSPTVRHLTRVMRLEDAEGLRYDTPKTLGFVGFMSPRDYFSIPGGDEEAGKRMMRVVPLKRRTEDEFGGSVDKKEPEPADGVNKEPSSTLPGVGEPVDGKNEESIEKPAEWVHAWVYPSPAIPNGHLAISKMVRETAGLVPYDRVCLMELLAEPIPSKSAKIIVSKASYESKTPSEAQSIILKKNKQNALEVEEKHLASSFADWVTQVNISSNLILTSGTLIRIPLDCDARTDKKEAGDEHLLVHIRVEDVSKNPHEVAVNPVTVLGGVGMAGAMVVIGKPGVRIESKEPTREVDFNPPLLGGLDDIVDTLIKKVKSRVVFRMIRDKFRSPSIGGILLTGNRGYGKTSVMEEVSHRLSHSLDTLTHCITVNCATLQNLNTQTLRTHLNKTFTAALYHAPSLIILDNLDRICPSHDPNDVGGGGGGDPVKSIQVAEILKREMEEASRCRKDVAVVGTAIDRGDVGGRLMGGLAFVDFVGLKAPDKRQRQAILKATIASLPLIPSPSIDYLKVATSTEGYSPNDLKSLMERAVHISTLKAIKDASSDDKPDEIKLPIDQGHLDKAMKEYVPPNLRGLKAVEAGIGWGDIGGLYSAKSILKETLEYPTKYAEIFKTCPLRLRSGLLLYGYPGCGKTLLASAVSKECGLNFISVKGPEILNKYIGASEKAIRDLFDRAQAAKPCVLFFDEFESVAPRRGNDNTGVTDRVVNQMLTAMDGAEGLDGVYVLAATSRPDLIDPALLRPGRLDKSILCNMPDFEERKDILLAVSKKFKLSDAIDWDSVALKTEGFSGADLQGFMYSASLEAIHGYMHRLENKGVTTANVGGIELGDIEVVQVAPGGIRRLGSSGGVVDKIKKIQGKAATASDIASKPGAKASEPMNIIIDSTHIEAALASAKPSVAADERRRFERIYAEFTGEALPSAKAVGKRTMMA
ncbi:Peroxisome biosynthesis protein pex1 [Dinochytrium kinnereticum]|nr:Peroxisome biosynthesis protein pex1 [Dinochytrium kinnereticum]